MSIATEPMIDDVWQQIPASWRTYRRLLRDKGDRASPRYTYIQRRLTIVSPGTPHEVLKKRVGGLIEAMCVALDIDYLGFGSSNYLKYKKGRAGTEPDESYYLTHIGQMFGTERVVIGRDPAPDLIVEVVFSHPADDALEVYRRFGVREVWVCDRSGIVFHILGEDGRYAISPQSVCFPFLSSEELDSWAYREGQTSNTKLLRQFLIWVQETLVPRRGAER